MAIGDAAGNLADAPFISRLGQLGSFGLNLQGRSFAYVLGASFSRSSRLSGTFQGISATSGEVEAKGSFSGDKLALLKNGDNASWVDTTQIGASWGHTGAVNHATQITLLKMTLLKSRY